MNGFLVISLESGFLLCSRSYVEDDFGMGPLGCNHLQLSSTLFAFHHMSAYATEKECVEPIREMHKQNDSSRSEESGSDGSADGMQQATGLLWLKLGNSFLHFQETAFHLNDAKEGASLSCTTANLNESGVATGRKLEEENDHRKFIKGSMQSEPDRISVLIVLISDLNRSSIETGENAVLGPFIAGVQRRLQELCVQQRGSSVDSSSSGIWKMRIHEIIQDELKKYEGHLSAEGRKETDGRAIDAETLQEQFFRKLCEEDGTEESAQSWFERISQIPMRIIQALAKRKKQANM